MTDRKDKDITTPQDILSDETYFSRPRRDVPETAIPDAPLVVTDSDAPKAPRASEASPKRARTAPGAYAEEASADKPRKKQEPASAADRPSKKKKAPERIDLFGDDEDDSPAPRTETEENAGIAARLARALTAERGERRFSFGKSRKKQIYGKRAEAEKARTLVVTKETAATREMQEAAKRAAVRDEQRRSLLEREEKMKRMARAERVRKRLTVLFTFLIIAIVAAATFYFAFLVSSIEVVGELTRYSPNDIVLKSGLRTKRHILEQSLSDAEALLDADPYLDAGVAYVFPNRIRITVTERRQAAAVQWGPNGEYLAIIDKDGVVLESDVATYEGLLLVKGMVITGANKAQRIGEAIDEQVSAMLTMIQKLIEYGLSSKIAYLDMAETMSIGMYTADGYRIEVGGLDDLDIKLTRLNSKWTAIMTAAQQYAAAGSTTVTVYLYAKMGVTVSPYAPDYVALSSPDESTTIPYTTDPNATADPNATPDPNATVDPNATPPATDSPYIDPITPQPTNAPYASDPFSG